MGPTDKVHASAMKILAILIVLAIGSTSLAQSTSGLQQKLWRFFGPLSTLKGHYHKFPGPFPGPIGKEFQGIRTKPSIPYVDEELNTNHVGKGQDGHHIAEGELGRQVETEPRGSQVGVVQQGHPVEVVQRGRYVGAEHQGSHVEEEEPGHNPRGRHVDEDNANHFGKGLPGRHIAEEQLGGQVRTEPRGRHNGVVQQGHHVDVVQQDRHVVAEHQGSHVVERHFEEEERERNPPGRHGEVEHRGRHFGEENRSRQTRQFLLTVHVPPPGSLLGGSHAGGLHQDTLLPFPQTAGNHPGNTGSISVPGSVIILHPGASSGIASIGSLFRPESSGSFVQNGNSPFIPVTSTHGTSSAGTPGTGTESGLAGGLGGAYGAGYGLGFGGLIFGGPSGPVFAGNTTLNAGFRGNSGGAVTNSNIEQHLKQNDSTQNFRPIPSRGNSFNGATKATENNRVTGNLKPHYPNNNSGNFWTSSNGGETIGYVAFIFPKRSLQNGKATQPSNNFNPVKSHTDPATFKTNAVNHATPINNRPAQTYIPVPVHIPIDRPYPILVPKPYPVEVLKPYPVAVPFREPLPYEVTRPIPVPLTVPALLSRPSELPISVGLNGAESTVFQPSIGASILHKRSDTADAEKPET